MAALIRPWARVGALLGLLLLGALLARASGLEDILRNAEARSRALASLRTLSQLWWVGPAFAAGYGLLVALAVPASPLTLLGGASFGLVRGVLWVTLGANLGANLAFFLARRLGRASLEEWFGNRLAGFDRVSTAAGFLGLLTLRLLPIMPFNLLNFAAGLTPIRWGDYAWATALGILPGTIVYVFFADALLSGSAEASREAWVRVLFAGGLLVGFSLLSKWLMKRRPASSPPSSPR